MPRITPFTLINQLINYIEIPEGKRNSTPPVDYNFVVPYYLRQADCLS